MSQSVKDFKFYVKAVQDTGTFEGMAAVYGNVDLGGDVIAPGAFTRTLKSNGSKVPILWQHDQREPIGMGMLRDSKSGLFMDGHLVMESPVAQKALALMKAGVLTGLSIGYDAVKSEYDKVTDSRRLDEIKLYEVSLVTFPMNPKAQITSVKGNIDQLAGFIKTQIEEIRNGGRLSADTRDDLLSMGDQISALLAMDSGNDSTVAPATQQLSDSDLHSLMTSLQEIVSNGN